MLLIASVKDFAILRKSEHTTLANVNFWVYLAGR